MNLTRSLLVGRLPVPTSPETATLLITADVLTGGSEEPDAELGDAQRYRAHGVRLLAKGISSAVELARCIDAGFELFEGDWLDRNTSPDLESLSPNQTVALELVGRLSDPDTSMTEAENLVRHSPELAFRLLRIANSASSGSNREVSSLHDAIVMVGAARLRSWLMLEAYLEALAWTTKTSSAAAA